MQEFKKNGANAVVSDQKLKSTPINRLFAQNKNHFSEIKAREINSQKTTKAHKKKIIIGTAIGGTAATILLLVPLLFIGTQ